jgi:hypothetical protein
MRNFTTYSTGMQFPFFTIAKDWPIDLENLRGH